MSDLTVKQLAADLGALSDWLLHQMHEVGLPQQAEDEAVTDQQKQRLLEFLNHQRETHSVPSRITLKRTSVTTLKVGQGRGGRTVQVQSKRRRTYVRAAPKAEVEAESAAPPSAPALGQAELEAERIREQDLARKSAEEDVRRLEARKAEEQAERERERAREEAAEAQRREEELRKQVEEARRAEQAKTQEKSATDAAARAQAAAQAKERGGKRAKDRSKERERAKEPGFGARRRGELSMNRRSQRVRRRAPSRISVETRGGEFERPQESIQREVELGEAVQVGELARRMSVKAGEVIKTLMDMGVMATINQTLDQDTASLLVEEMGHKVKLVVADEVEHEHEETLRIEGQMEARSPVVTVMGHVDHGKTSLLDYIRNSRIVAGEAGGITQHIGAYRVSTEHGDISFLDTPGHAAFTAMRARGARSTDIVILVVAGDDGVMPQTEEAVQHAKAAGVPIIVAINKMDLEGVDPVRIRNELVALDVIPEELGGDTQFIEVSAQTGQGIDNLLESINLQAELLELRAARDVPGRGIVVESRLDRGRGPVATVLVQNGTLRRGDVLIAGERFGRVRLMLNERGDPVAEAGPSVPVEVLGLNGTPEAGDDFAAVADERRARELAELRSTRSQEQRLAKQQAAKIENLFANLKQGEKRVLKLVLKADVRGSLEAISQACADLGNDEVAVNLLGTGVGGITESDAALAMTYGAAIFGFNVRADTKAKVVIEREGMDLRYYSVIYELLDDIKMILQDMLAPEVREEILGTAEVRDVFRSPRFGQVAGCMVVDGAVARNKKIRVLRDNVVVFEGELESLRRFKDDVGEVRNGLECGIGVRNYNDVRVGDRIEVFEAREVARAL